ncbi:MAG TPA: hypothetical protein VF935_06035, partial [Candidatus Acidoferrum sp.]
MPAITRSASSSARRLSGAHRVHEFAQFGAQRLLGLYREFFKIELRLRPGLAHAHTQRIAARVVERNIFVFLEE